MAAALVTGASSGIGRELAMLFAQDHHDLVLVARNRKKLDELGRDLTAAFGVTAKVIAKDLSNPVAPDEIAAELAASELQVDALVNNAGLGIYGPFAQADAGKELEVLQVNVMALTRLTKLFLPSMLDRRQGRILNVASTAAFQPGPLMAVYYATKAYVLSFSEALSNEVKGSGVTVTALCPGPTETDFQRRAHLEKTRLFTGPLVADARFVALKGYQGMKRGRPVVIPGVANKLLAESIRFTPRRLVTAVARKIQETRK